MERVNKIYNHALYREAFERIKQAENERIFCLHGLQHSLDTARLMYIFSLEEGLDIKKDIIYAAAFLHDIGRYTGGPHSVKGAELAEMILPECGFDENEIRLITDAIRNHQNGNGSPLCRILNKSDGLSRSCHDCDAAVECYWDNERRNHEINY